MFSAQKRKYTLHKTENILCTKQKIYAAQKRKYVVCTKEKVYAAQKRKYTLHKRENIRCTKENIRYTKEKYTLHKRENIRCTKEKIYAAQKRIYVTQKRIYVAQKRIQITENGKWNTLPGFHTKENIRCTKENTDYRKRKMEHSSGLPYLLVQQLLFKFRYVCSRSQVSFFLTNSVSTILHRGMTYGTSKAGQGNNQGWKGPGQSEDWIMSHRQSLF